MIVRGSPPARRSRPAPASPPARGFSLVEVMVALVVCAIGLLGLAKMESLSVASTSVAAARSIAAIEASSLAAAMHANRGYWASGTAPGLTTVTALINNPISISSPVLSSVPPANCSVPGATSCTPDQMAAFDVQQWAASLQTLLPGSFSTITCTTVTSIPVTCTIQIQWTENAVAANAQQTQLNSLQTPTYVLYVQP
jgi:type IV pilus assembly protein PilV